MSGGIAYVWDRASDFETKCNKGTFEIELLEEEEDIKELRTLIEKHEKYTSSSVAREILDNWESELKRFKKVMPTDYKRVLKELADEQELTAAVGS